MSRRNRQYERGDDPIDWSGFDERSDREGPVDGSTPLRIVCAVMIVAGIAALIGGINAFGAEMEQLGSSGEMGSFAPLFVAIAGALTLIPAAFGLQIAGNPVSFVPPTVFGLVGIAMGIVMTGVSVFMAASGAEAPVWPWVVAIVLAFLYLFFVVRVHKAANARHSKRRRRPTKDEMWDEKNIWK